MAQVSDFYEQMSQVASTGEPTDDGDQIGVGRHLESGHAIARVFSMVGDAFHGPLQVFGGRVRSPLDRSL